MRSKLVFAVLLIFCATSNLLAQAGVTIHVSGKYILGPCNDTLILKGVDYAPYNWGWSPTQLNINQIALTGANCVRMPWYVNTPDGPTPQATYNNLVFLDSALSKCVQKKMIPILTLQDLTCASSTSSLITLANWYVTPTVKALINKYKHSIIINIANEALWVAWASNTITAQTSYTNTYISIVNTIRSNSITVPIMIDAPDCGTNLDVLANVGQTMQNADPLNNLIFSAHAYWYNYANNDSLQALAKINYAISKNIPFVFGEVSNLQDGTTMCQYTLNYKPWMKILKQKKIGWMAWSWDNDGCAQRQLSTNGNFSSLTSYGNDIVNNSIYGLSVGTVKSAYLINNQTCPAATPTANFNTPISICSGVNFTFTNTSLGATNYSWTINGGSPATSTLMNPSSSFASTGIYSITLFASNGSSLSSITKTITVVASPTLSIASSTNQICSGQSSTLSVTGANNYSWSPGSMSGANIVVSPSVTTTYTVTGTNTLTGCSSTKTITQTVSICNNLTTYFNTSQLSIFPNPSKKSVTISSTEPLNFTIVNELGQTIKRSELSPANQFNEVLNDLDPGFYFLIGKNAHSSIIKKIIITGD